ncbi:MAG: hypothetical protein AAB658_21770, partial [Chloroflexota bacterium]
RIPDNSKSGNRSFVALPVLQETLAADFAKRPPPCRWALRKIHGEQKGKMFSRQSQENPFFQKMQAWSTIWALPVV